LELNAVAYILLRSSTLTEQTLTVPAAIVKSFISPRRIALIHYFPAKDGRFICSLVAFRNTAKKKTDQIDDKARFALSKQNQSLTSLALMRLVSGADRVVRHICIRCFGFFVNACFREKKIKTPGSRRKTFFFSMVINSLVS